MRCTICRSCGNMESPCDPREGVGVLGAVTYTMENLEYKEQVGVEKGGKDMSDIHLMRAWTLPSIVR